MNEVWIIATVESVILLAYCIYTVHNYAAKDRTPFYVKALTVIGWLLGYMIILLIPLDIYTVSTDLMPNLLLSSTKLMDMLMIS